MVKRIITAAVCLALFIPTLVFSGKVPLLFMSVIGVLALISAYEICGCIGVRKAFYVSLPTYITVIAVMALSIVYVKQYQAIPLKMFASLILAILFIYLFVTFSASMFSDGGVRFSQTCEMTAFTMYMLIGYLAIIFTRYADMGNYLFLLIFIGVWLTDTGAYFVGSFLGNHKLIPNISPKKTVEGAIGGILGCILGYVIYAVILNKLCGVEVNYIYLTVLAVLVSVVDQIGDLIASFVKREHDMKDFGNIFPGHGGVLDRFDSTLAVAPFIFFILFFTKIVIFRQ